MGEQVHSKVIGDWTSGPEGSRCVKEHLWVQMTILLPSFPPHQRKRGEGTPKGAMHREGAGMALLWKIKVFFLAASKTEGCVEVSEL